MPLLAALVIALLVAPAAQAKKPNRTPAEVAAYWTDARMKDAKPRERAKPGGGGGGGKTTSDWSRITVPTPYSGLTALNGKLFFTIDGSRFVCSATAVDATAGVNLVWTAGHCVTDGVQNGVEHKATDILFVPGYLNGSEPYGRWAATSSDSTEGWESSGGQDFRYDVGAARVVRIVNGATTAATFLGTLGDTRAIRFGPSIVGSKVISYGYPAAGKFKGRQQYACRSLVRRTDQYSTASPAPVQIGCDMTGGSSGGGWLLDANGDRVDDAADPLVSVNSYGYGFESSTMYGPQMPSGGQAQALYDRMD